jgi:hypothetical protein
MEAVQIRSLTKSPLFSLYCVSLCKAASARATVLRRIASRHHQLHSGKAQFNCATCHQPKIGVWRCAETTPPPVIKPIRASP